MTAFYQWLWYLLPANPIVVRIVQGGSRRQRDLWVRMGYLGALILMVVVGLLRGGMGEKSLTELAKAGSVVFQIVAYGQVVLVCLLAPLFMAGAIAQEQAGQTYDILLTTPLSNLQIVLGSLLGRLFFVWGLLISGLPLFAVLLLFGGVPISAIFEAFAVAALTALLVGAVAVMLSVSRTGGRKAVYVFIIAIAAYLLVSYGVDMFIRDNRPLGSKETTVVTPLHPLLVLEASINAANYMPPAPEDLPNRHWLTRFYLCYPLGAFAAFTALGSMLLTLYSAIGVRHIGEGEGMIQLGARLRKWLKLGSVGARRWNARTVWANPIAWREAHARGNRWAVILGRWLFLALGLALGAALILLYHTRQLKPVLGLGGTKSDADWFHILLTGLLLLELAVIVMVALYMSAGSVSREREDGTLDLLLTTPITPKQYLWGKLRGLVSFLMLLIAAPVLTVLLASVYTTVGLVLQWPQAQANYTVTTGGSSGTARYELILPEAALLLPFLLIPFVALCVTVGMHHSVKSKGVLGAVIWAVAIIGLIALFGAFCGFSAAQNIPLIGPVLNAFSPATNLVMLIDPWWAISGFGSNPEVGRVNLAMAALIAAGTYSLIVYFWLQAMVRSFDQTVRKISGASN